MRFEKSVVINAPAEKVFAYVSDLTNMSEWGSFMTQVVKTSEGPIGVGTTFDAGGKQFGKHTDKTTVTELVPGKRFVAESRGDAGHTLNSFVVEDQGGTTKLTKALEFVKKSASSTLGTPLVKRIAPKGLEKDLARIKANIEGSVA